MTINAWKVQGWDSDYGHTEGIVFAGSLEEAIEEGLHAGFNGETGDWDKKATPWAMPQYNQYADLGYVPPAVLISDGWGLPCEECGHIVDSENEQETPDGMWTEDGLYYPDPVIEGRKVFCCQSCADIWNKEYAGKNARREDARALIMRRYPLAQNLSIYGGSLGYRVYVDFDFGGKRQAEWCSETDTLDESLKINGQDKEAWTLFVKACKAMQGKEAAA